MMAHAVLVFAATAYAFADTKRNKNQDEHAPMQDILLKFISGSYPPPPRRHAACSTKPQLLVTNLHVLFFQTLSAGRVWSITKGCSTSRPCSPLGMKTSTSSSLASLVCHLELLRKEPAYDQRLVRPGTSDRAKHIWTLLCYAQEEDDSNKPAKSHAVLANSKGAKGKTKKSTIGRQLGQACVTFGPSSSLHLFTLPICIPERGAAG
jgi:hypothetical protein